jgi:hypothetical protein
VANREPEETSLATKAAQQLEDTLEAIDSGSVTASAAQRAYLAGACQALRQLAGALV